MISLKLLLFPVIVNILKKEAYLVPYSFFFLFPIFFTTKSVLTDFRLYLPNQPKSSIGYPTRPVWSRFLYQWETIIAHKTQLPCGNSQSSLSVFKCFLGNCSTILFPLTKQMSDQLSNKQDVIQSKSGKKSIPQRFHILHHSRHFHLTLKN